MRRLYDEKLLLVLIAGLVCLLLIVPFEPSELPGLVDWQTLSILAGLMILSRGLQDSRFLARAGHWLVRRAGGQRRLALVLVLFAAMLAAVVTNDVALFIVIPLTLALAALTDLPLARLVIFQALAVNAGSILSPVGNPQNLFLWRASGMGFVDFLVLMLPLGLLLTLLLVLAIPLAFRAEPLDVRPAPWNERLDPLLGWLSLLLYLPFLVAVERGWAFPALVAVLLLYLLRFRPVLARVDWLLLVVFLLMFLDLGLLAQLPVFEDRLAAVLETSLGVYLAGIGLSQLLSNVPAAIFLEAFTDDWRALAWGVSVGGFGLAIGSLANLIALRMVRLPGLVWQFHLWSVPMLLVTGLLGGLLLLRFPMF